MPAGDAFKVEGRVTEVLANGTYRAELKNGHRLTAFVTGKAKKNFAGLKSGDVVRLQLTPYDLSTGRILIG
ncbi:MAG TPA: translation initiation factor IF-1 [Candidatus Acidoferrales bacterium]|nr:translation initiation factor IF-1 [Candidatus Acidoferrales bacterium]